MKVRVPGHGARVAEEERPTYARGLTARRAMNHPGLGTERYVKDVEVDTDEEETPASTPPSPIESGRRIIRSTSAAEVDMEGREEPTSRFGCFQTELDRARALQSAKAESTQARVACK
ncbi:hypothetical protein AXG93_3828s1030 [Marchantia polymorpha subsp. ruderalis]|uniref:Uncharacterized protein n=1 Tax=Marchantia polymorpha subsp. ruderalis TaxID=1480154 RepID=A0A176VEX9_MARPO|nr:hypothetical protein AXG93_3828s1030 [Marchantia polymorpha subsp. ruderalis]